MKSGLPGAPEEQRRDLRAAMMAVREVVEEYELYSLNFVLGELGHIWAFRYPEHNPLLLHRRDPGASSAAELDHADPAGTATALRTGPGG